MNHSPKTPNHKGLDKDTKKKGNILQLVDIQVSIRNYQHYAQRAAATVQKLKGRISNYENRKILNDYQEKARAEAEEVVITFLGLQKCAREMIDHFEKNNAGLCQDFEKSKGQNEEYHAIMHEKFTTLCRKNEELKKENEELREMLHKFIIDFAA